MDKGKIRPIYSELQGYLSQVANENNYIFEKTLWDQYNQAIEELNKVTGRDYNKFLLKPENLDWNRVYRWCIRSSVYRSTIAGIISRLYGEFFSDEINPLSGSPSTIINQTQQQNQSVDIELLFQLRDDINQKLEEVKDSKEKTFLEKIKTGLSSVKNYSQIIALVLKVGAELGLTVEQMMKLLGK